VEGFIITCDRPAFLNGGATYTNPSLSPVAITNTGTPPSSGKALYFGTQASPTPYVGNGYIEFPPIVSPAGSTISVQWKQVGTYTYGKLVKNDVVLADLLSLSGSSWASSAAYTFTSSGDDRLYIQINNNAATPSASLIYYNISDIAITQYTAGSSTDAVVGMNGSTLQMSNATSGARVEARSSDGAAALYSSTGTGSSIVAATNISLTTTLGGSAVNINSSNINLTNGGNIVFSSSPTQMSINGGANTYLNLANGSGLVQITGNSVYMSGSAINIQSTPVYFNSSSLNMNSNNINLVGALTAGSVDANSGSNINIGLYSASNSVGLYNVNTLSGTLTSGGGTGFTISNCKMLNLSPACPPASAFYLANFSGTKGLSMTIPPKQFLSTRNNVVFGSGYTSDSFISNQGFTIPAYSVMSYSNIGSGTTTTYSNTNSVPYFYSDSGFSPSSSTQVYSLNPILV
jgi:hypothetical protein